MYAEWQATFVCSGGSGGPRRRLFLTVRRRAGFRLFSERSRRRRPRFINLYIMKFVTAAPPLPPPADHRHTQTHPRMYYGLFQEFDIERAENLYHTYIIKSSCTVRKKSTIIRDLERALLFIEISRKSANADV